MTNKTTPEPVADALPPLPDVPEPWDIIDGEWCGQNVKREVFTVTQLRTYATEYARAALASRDAEIAKLKGWRDAIDEALVVAHIGVATEPYDDLNRLLDWHHDVWLDPAVSSDAQALIDRGAAEERQRTAQPAQAEPRPDMADAYVGAREDLAIWKRRALAAEEQTRHLAAALAEEVNGPTFMGEPVLAQPKQEPQPMLTDAQIDAAWSALGSFTERRADNRLFARAIERLVLERKA